MPEEVETPKSGAETMLERKTIVAGAAALAVVAFTMGALTARLRVVPSTNAGEVDVAANAASTAADGNAIKGVALTSPKPVQAGAAAKPNIIFIMGDDIGWMQPSIYHRGLMVGETPNIDRIEKEGAIFMDYLAMQSCTSGRNAFFTGMYPLRTGMIPPQLPGSPSYLRPGTPALAVFLRDLGYTTGEFGKNHLGDHTASLPTAHGFQEYWGYLSSPGRDAAGKLPRYQPKYE